MEFISNGMFDEVQSLIAKEGEERVEVLYSRSAYGHDKKHMNKIETNIFKYPCADNINSKSEIGNVYYSDTNENGHFGIPKLIFGTFGTNSFIDENGEFGMSDNCRAFVDTIENLKLIKEALGSEDFKLINKMLNVRGNNHKTLHFISINYKVIKLFRKDFYKDFI